MVGGGEWYDGNTVITWPGVLQTEVLISELLSIDRSAPSAVVVGEVARLAHEVGDDAMEAGAFVSKALLSSAQSSEVLAEQHV